MVVYVCERCQKQFNQKCVYDKHIDRKVLCHIKKKQNNEKNSSYCKVCDKHFSRSDALKRHNATPMHKQMKKQQNININAKTKNGNINQIIGDKNLIVNNYYFISPFSQEEIDKLTTQEKIAIFSSDENPIIMIVIKTNLNPSNQEYHNVGYTDLNSGYGYIFNGETWEKKGIKTIMEDLLNSKRKDLIKIYNEIKDFLSEEDNKNIENKLDDIENDIEPKYEHHIRSKRRLVTNLKTRFYNNKHLIIEAMQKSGKTIVQNKSKNKSKNILKDGLTIDELDRLLKIRKKNSQKIILKKEIALDLLEELINDMNDAQYLSLIDVIEKTCDIPTLNIIIRLLDKSYCFKNKINYDIIQDKIKKEEEINKIIFGQ